MHAILAREPGGPDVLSWEEIPVPTPGPGELLVRLHAAGVNFIDTYQRSGVYPMRFPHVPGSEGSGTVVGCGPDVPFAVGERVAWSSAPGSYAEYVLVPAASALAVPDGVDLDTAAALPLQGLTAHYLTRSTHPVSEGTTVLLTAGAGGVGQLVIQLAKARGATVITTVGTRAKAALAREAGADHVLVMADLAVADLPDAVRALVPGGVDVSYDGVGRDTFEATLACLRPRGLQVLFGGASGQVPPFDLQRLNALGSLFVTRPSLGAHIATREELEWRAGELFGMVAEGTLRVRIGRTEELRRARVAHEALEGRATTGKVLLTA